MLQKRSNIGSIKILVIWGECLLYVNTLKKYIYEHICIHMYISINIELDFYLPVVVCSTNVSSMSDTVVIFYYINLLLFRRIL